MTVALPLKQHPLKVVHSCVCVMSSPPDSSAIGTVAQAPVKTSPEIAPVPTAATCAHTHSSTMEGAAHHQRLKPPVQRQKSRKSVPLFNPQVIGALGMAASSSPAGASAGHGEDTEELHLGGTKAKWDDSMNGETGMTFGQRFSVAAILVRGEWIALGLTEFKSRTLGTCAQMPSKAANQTTSALRKSFPSIMFKLHMLLRT